MVLFIKNNCELSNKLLSITGDTFRIINTNDVKLPDELKDYEVPFIIVKNINKPTPLIAAVRSFKKTPVAIAT